MKLVKIFNDVLNNQKPYVYKTPPHFKIKPADLGTPCQRKLFYSSGMVEKDYDFDLDGKKRMALGDAISGMLTKILEKSGTLVKYYNPDGTFVKSWKDGSDDYEFPLKEPALFMDSGKIDGVFIIDGKLWLAEYKSINMRGFEGLVAPKLEHMIQGVTYLYVFNKYLQEGKFNHIKELQGFEKAEGVLFLYVNKDDTQMKEFEVTQTDALFQMIVEKIYQAKEAYDKQILPAKTPDFCRTCPWRDKCKKNQVK